MFKKNKVTTKEQLDELYNCSALTFTGVIANEQNLKYIENWIKEYSEVSNPLTMHIISGKVMNNNYNLTGSNAYPNHLTLISIKTNDIKNLDAITIPRFKMGGRWFDDIVDNNAMREKDKMSEIEENSEELE